MTGTVREGQGRRREAGSRGSLEQIRDLRNTNRIRGLASRANRLETTKPYVIKGAGGKCGGSARKVMRLIPGDLCP